MDQSQVLSPAAPRMKCAAARGHSEIHTLGTEKKLVTIVNFLPALKEPPPETHSGSFQTAHGNEALLSSEISVPPMKQTFPSIKIYV